VVGWTVVLSGGGCGLVVRGLFGRFWFEILVCRVVGGRIFGCSGGGVWSSCRVSGGPVVVIRGDNAHYCFVMLLFCVHFTCGVSGWRSHNTGKSRVIQT
jgi:hypothetical protein